MSPWRLELRSRAFGFATARLRVVDAHCRCAGLIRKVGRFVEIQSSGVRGVCGGRPRNQANQSGSVCRISSTVISRASTSQIGTQTMAAGRTAAANRAVSTPADMMPRYPTHPRTCPIWLGLARRRR